MQKVLPYVMGGAMLGMIAIMFAGGRQLSPYMLMMPLMMIVMMVGSLAGVPAAVARRCRKSTPTARNICVTWPGSAVG
ncbi:hypothetical protein NIIDMKKI_77550 [Mycobacterium kansasii]|uniref:Uncharacterized protein n=1 Tax=Mycobacterium kansasii TaxID=1768 RepID=A0A7G1IRF2_MYCKA|nr:hypothetical protein NIIDMKKI_77550 [Mycobacterium kansasii]